MTIAELHMLILAVCPAQGVDSNGNISFDPSATPQQQQSAQAVVVQNLSKVNGQPSRQANDILNIFNYIKPAANNLTAAQLNTLQLLCCAVVLNQFPELARRINQNMGVSIPYDQANPNG